MVGGNGIVPVEHLRNVKEKSLVSENSHLDSIIGFKIPLINYLSYYFALNLYPFIFCYI